jgi:hypothetical protein
MSRPRRAAEGCCARQPSRHVLLTRQCESAAAQLRHLPGEALGRYREMGERPRRVRRHAVIHEHDEATH